MNRSTPRTLLGRILPALLAALVYTASGAARAQDPSELCGTSYVPAENVFGTFLAEDLWPSNGDYDFNDAVIGYNFQFLTDGFGNVRAIQVNLSALAAGATLHNGVYLHLPISANTAFSAQNPDGSPASIMPGESEMVFQFTNDLHTALGNTTANYINTQPGQPGVPASSTGLTITFQGAIPLDQSQAPYDLFLARSDNYAYQIHMPQYAGTDQMDQSLFGKGDDRSAGGVHFINEQGLPFAIAVPDLIVWPQERVSIEQVYPDIVEFASSGGLAGNGWYQDGTTVQEMAFNHGSNGVQAEPDAPDTNLTCSVEAAPLIAYVPNTVTCRYDQPCNIPAPINSGGPIDGFNNQCVLPSCDLWVNADGSINGWIEPWDNGGVYPVTIEAYNAGGVSDTTLTITVIAPPQLDNNRSSIHVDTPFINSGQTGQVTVTLIDTTGAPIANTYLDLWYQGSGEADCPETDANGVAVCQVFSYGQSGTSTGFFFADVFLDWDFGELQSTDTMTIQGCANTPSNLIAWFRLDGNLVDSQNQATASSGDEEYGPGYIGNASFSSNGAGSNVSGNAPGMDGISDVTVEFWFQPTSVPTGTATLFSFSDGIHGLGLTPDGNVTMSGSGIGSAPVPYGAWTHVAITLSNSQQTETYYVNGVSTGSAPFSGSIGAGFSFGSFAGSYTDEVSIYSRALDPSEIQAIFNAGQNGKCE